MTKPCATPALALLLLLGACSRPGEPERPPAWPELQYEPPALVEIVPEPLLAQAPPDEPGRLKPRA